MEKITVLGTQNPVGLRNAINETLGQFVPAHIVGATFSAAWLSETEGGNPLTPVVGRLYTVVTAGDYKNQLFRWNDATYEQVGGKELPSHMPVTARTVAVTTAGITPTSELYLLPNEAGIMRDQTVFGDFAKYLDRDIYPVGSFRIKDSGTWFAFNQGDIVYNEGRRLTRRKTIHYATKDLYIDIYDDRITCSGDVWWSSSTPWLIYNINDPAVNKYTVPVVNLTANSHCELIALEPYYVKAQNVRPFFDIVDGGIVMTVDGPFLQTPILATLKAFDTSDAQSIGTIINYDNYRIEQLGIETTAIELRVTDLEAAGIPTYAEYAVSDYDVAVLGSNGIVYIKLDTLPAHGNRYYAFVKGSILLQDGTDEYDYFVSGSVDLEEAPTAVSTYNNASVTPNIRMCTYYPEVPEFRVVTPNLNIATPITKSQTLKLCVINF